MIAARHEPLFARDVKTARHALGCRLDAGGVGARVTLGDGVRVGTLARQRRQEIRLNLLGGAERQNVVTPTHQPPEPVGDAPELLVHDHVLHHLPALAAMLHRMVTADQTGFTRETANLGLDLGCNLAAALLCRDLVWQERICKCTCAQPKVVLLRGQGEIHWKSFGC